MVDEEKEMPDILNISPNISKKRSITEKVRENPWIISTFILGIIILLLIAGNVFGLTGKLGLTGKTVSASEAGNNLIAYLESSGYTAEVSSVMESNGLYLISLLIDGKEDSIFMTKDGDYAVSGLIPLSSESDTSSETQTQDIPKTDKPSVELFVMSFCPYGVKAENNIFPVIESLKDKMDFNIRFIVNVGGDKIENVQSLHGTNEAK